MLESHAQAPFFDEFHHNYRSVAFNSAELDRRA